MATYVGRIVHQTLTPNTIDTITLDASYASIEIINRDGSAELYVTTDPNQTLTVGGTNCDVLPAVIGSLTLTASPAPNFTTVRLISTGAVAYSVKAM